MKEEAIRRLLTELMNDMVDFTVRASMFGGHTTADSTKRKLQEKIDGWDFSNE